jgi:hypothetical protein
MSVQHLLAGGKPTQDYNAPGVVIQLLRSTNLPSNVWNRVTANTADSWSLPGTVLETGAGNPANVETNDTTTNQPETYYRLLVE